MATYWENTCSFGLRYVSWYKCLIVSLVFSHLGFWSGNLFLIAPFLDLCLLVPFPMEVVLHKNLLNMYVNMIRNDNSIEYEIAHRQLVMIDPQQKSLFNYIRDILNFYELPSIFSLLNNPPTKEEWKGMLNHKIHGKVESLWQADIASKSSTKHVNASVLKVDMPSYLVNS